MQNIGLLIRKLREKEGYPLRKVASFLDIDQAVESFINENWKQRKPGKHYCIPLSDL